MKVLWFTNTPCMAIHKLSPDVVTGGWLIALEQEIKTCDNIDLYICFYYNKKIEPFEFDNVHYYPMYKSENSSKIKILLNRYRDYFIGMKNQNMDILQQVVDAVKPDIIHYHGSESDFGLLQYIIKDIPSVLSIQGLLNPCYEKLFSGIPKSIASRHESFLSKILLDTVCMSDKQFVFAARREKEILSITKNIIGRTDWDRHVAMILAPQAKYHIGNEILRDEFYHVVWSKKHFEDKFTIVSTISTGNFKGLEVVLKTANCLKELGFNFKWIVIGQDESSTYASMVSKWLNLSYYENNVQLVGRKNASQLIELLLKADVYCQVSHIENSPNSVCEAMLLGMPIVASLAGGTNSIIEHLEEGYLLQDGDSFALAGTLIDVSRNFEMARIWGEKARKRALIRHNPQRVANEYIKIYQSLISST